MYQIKQSSTARPLMFLMVDGTDHVTGKTGLSPTVTLSKNGASFASPSGVVSEVGSGWYKVAGNATDSNTLGPLALHATATGADPTDVMYDVVALDPHDGVRAGLTALPNAAADAAGGLPISDAGGLDLDAQRSDVAAILVDTGTTLQGELDGIQADTEDIQSKIGSPAGASVSADIAAVKVDTAAILVDTGTTLDGKIDAILADTGTDGVVIATATQTAIADALLNRDMGAGTDSNTRSPRNALRALRNKVSVPDGIVYKEDDSTAAWSFTTTTDAAEDPITVITPA